MVGSIKAAEVNQTYTDGPVTDELLAASNSLDTTSKLEIGQYDRTSAGSRPDFFNRGEIKAALKASGTSPFARELLNRSVKNGAMMSTTALSGLVGRGSDAWLLSGRTRTVATTSRYQR